MVFRLLFLLISFYSYCQSNAMYDGDAEKVNVNHRALTKKLIYIYAGQSNTGLSYDMPPDSSKYYGIIEGVGFYNYAYNPQWTNLHVGLNTFIDPLGSYFAEGFGMEGCFGYNMVQLLGSRIYIIKYGCSGTSLQNNWKFGGTQYNKLVSAITDAIDSLLKTDYFIDIKGFIWMQGESDAGNEVQANNYLANLTTFFQNINKEIDSVYMPFGITTDTAYTKVIGRIGTYNFGYQNTVRRAQIDYCNARNDSYWIDTDTYTRHADGVHFTSQDQIRFGWSCYNIFKHKKNTNTSPVFSSIAIPSIAPNSEYNYNIRTLDDDEDKLIITAPIKPDWLTIKDFGDGTALLRGTPCEIGNYEVKLTVSDGIDSVDQDFIIIVSIPNSIEDNHLSNLKVYPNPVSDVLNFKNKDQKSARLKIYSIAGNEIVHVFDTDGSINLDISDYPQGIYIYSYKNSDGVKIGKIIKE